MRRERIRALHRQISRQYAPPLRLIVVKPGDPKPEDADGSTLILRLRYDGDMSHATNND